MTPRKIMLISTNSSSGGSERVVLDLTKGLAARGHNVVTYLSDHPSTQVTREWFAGEGVQVRLHPGIRVQETAYKPGRLLALRALFRQEKPDAINIHYGGQRIGFLDAAVARTACSAKIISSIHHPYAWDSRYWHHKLRTRAGFLFSSAATVTTPLLAEVLREATGPSKRIHVVPLGVDKRPPSADIATLRRTYNIPENSLVIGSLARLIAQKGFFELLAASASLLAKFSTLYVLIAGNGNDRDAIVERGRLLLGERVRFVGWVDNPADVYKASDLFAMPSHDEGFGLVFLEAARHGILSVACDVGGVRCAIEHNHTGLLVPRGDVPALEAALDTLLSNPSLRVRMGHAAQDRAEREFTIERMAERYEALLVGPLPGVPAEAPDAQIETSSSPGMSSLQPTSPSA